MVQKEVEALELQFDRLVKQFEQRLRQVDRHIARIHAVCDNVDKLLAERTNKHYSHSKMQNTAPDF